MGNCSSSKIHVKDESAPVGVETASNKATPAKVMGKHAGARNNIAQAWEEQRDDIATQDDGENMANEHQSSATQEDKSPATSSNPNTNPAHRPNRPNSVPSNISRANPPANAPVSPPHAASPASPKDASSEADLRLTPANEAPLENKQHRESNRDKELSLEDMIASDNWTQREAALKRLAEECRTTTSGNESALWSKTVGAVARLVRDKVTPVFLASSAALQAAALRCGSSIARDDLLDGLRKVLPALLHRTGNVHSRIRAECVSTFSALSRATGPAFIVDSLVVDVPQGKQLAPHLCGRLEAILAVMRQAGRTNSEPVNRPAVINLVRKGLEHTDDKLRRASGRLAVHLYRESRSAGETVDVSQLTGGLNPALTRALHRHMHAVDAELGLPSLVPEDDAPVAKSALPEDRPTASLPPVARRPGALKPIKSKAVGAPGGVLAGVMGWGLNEGEKADGTSEMWSTVGSLPKVLDDTDEALLEAMLESHQA